MIRLFSLRDFTGRELHLLFLLIEYLKLVLRGGHEGSRKNCLGPHLYIYQESCPYLIDMITISLVMTWLYQLASQHFDKIENLDVNI